MRITDLLLTALFVIAVSLLAGAAAFALVWWVIRPVVEAVAS